VDATPDLIGPCLRRFSRKAVSGGRAVTKGGSQLQSSGDDSLPPDEVREWIDRTANLLGTVLANPQVRTRVVELLGGDAQGKGCVDETSETP
jgi:hypothetical protein